MIAKPEEWRKVYTSVETDLGSQYEALLSRAEVARRTVERDERLVDARGAPETVRRSLALVGTGLAPGEHDLGDQLSLDRLDRDCLRARPLSYAYHKGFHAALDARPANPGRPGDAVSSLRERLSRNGRPHPVDSDLAPVKLGICALLADRKGGGIRILETLRAKHLSLYPDTRHASFSGGVDIQDLRDGDPSLSGLIARAAVRECREELGVAIAVESVTVLGLWREMERCTLQSFAVAEIEDLDALRFVPDPRELQSFRIRRLDERCDAAAPDKPKSAELDFLERHIAATGFFAPER